MYKYKKESITSYLCEFHALECETLESSNTFPFFLYFALHISASSTPRISDAILFLVYSFFICIYLSKQRKTCKCQ